MNKKSIVSSSSIGGLIQRTLNKVDKRLVDHGIRVAYLVSGMLKEQNKYTIQEQREQILTAILHDIGAYKTEEIDRMVQFECEDVWEHTVYGYLFLLYLSPISAYADAVLYHHTSSTSLDLYETEHRELAQMIHLADRADLFLQNSNEQEALLTYLKNTSGTVFDRKIVELFFKAEETYHLLSKINQHHDLGELLYDDGTSSKSGDKYLRMLIYAIDFRSEHTVTHTITTTFIGYETARLIGLPPESLLHIYYGALLHDLGKIGIPVEILEFPGKLSPQAMGIMRTHVDITEEILNGDVDTVTANIALRHHEKLDGSGYPRGLIESQLTLEEQIVGIADIVSALLGTRSYKSSFSKERTLSILKEQAEEGKLNARVVDIIVQHFDEIMSEVRSQCEPILKIYHGIQEEYKVLLAKYSGHTV